MSFVCKIKKKITKKDPSLSHNIYSKVDDIPKELFNAEFIKSNLYLSHKYLKSVEDGNPNIAFRYFELSKDNELIGFAYCQIIEINFNTEIKIESPCIITREILSFISKHNQKKPFVIMVCGNIFINGKNGYALKDGSDKSQIFKELLCIIENSAEDKKENKNQAILFKDFSSLNEKDCELLVQKQFNSLATEPAMILEINPEWNDYQDYLQALKTKYRTKAKKALKESAVLEVKDLNYSELESQLPRLTELYNEVEKKASFSLGKIDLNTYVNLKKNAAENFIFRTYSYENKIIGFLSAFINGEDLDAHYIGLDYDYNKQYYVYQRILYDYVDIAIQKKLKTINYGRSATEIKSTIGAAAIEQFCYIKHRKHMQNHLIRPFSKNIKSPESKLIKPFK